jgi:hypothetical protein
MKAGTAVATALATLLAGGIAYGALTSTKKKALPAHTEPGHPLVAGHDYDVDLLLSFPGASAAKANQGVESGIAASSVIQTLTERLATFGVSLNSVVSWQESGKLGTLLFQGVRFTASQDDFLPDSARVGISATPGDTGPNLIVTRFVDLGAYAG